MKSRILIFFFLLPALTMHAQVSVTKDGSNPNANAVLDIKSPTTGHGLGFLIRRLTYAQRVTPNTAGGLINNTGEFWGGAAQGLLVLQTDSVGNDDEGIYYNNSTTSLLVRSM